MIQVSDKSNRRTALGGIFVRRERWALSLIGTSFALIILVLFTFAGFLELNPFLAITERVPSDTLVVDGWLPTYDLEKAAEEFRRGHYQRMLVVRAYYQFESIDHDPGNSSYITSVMARKGISPDRVNMVVFPGYQKDRTFFSATAIRDWLAQHAVSVSSLNLATLGPHARRSRLLYQKALGEDVQIGVIALDDPAYDARHWWRFSEGVREVLFEGVAYVYVRFIFSSPHP
jgi:hypothetical protein